MTSLAELRAEIDASVERDKLELKRTGNYDRYRRDPLLWVDECVWIASKFSEAGQRVRIRPVKMRLYPDQREAIGSWLDLERLRKTGELEFGNVLIEKSRQIGMTWGLAAMVRWLLSYTSTRGLFMLTKRGSRSERRTKSSERRLGAPLRRRVSTRLLAPWRACGFGGR